MAEDEAEDRDGADEGDGDAPGDDLAGKEPEAADEHGQGAYLADAAGDAAEEDGAEAHVLGQRLTGVEVGERGGHRGGVNTAGEHAGHGPNSHIARVGRRQEGAAREGGVQEVLAYAAVELLHDHNGEEGADDYHPPLRLGGQDADQQQRRYNGGEIADGGVFLHELSVSPLEEHAGDYRDRQQHYHLGAEHVHADRQGGDEADYDVQHYLLGAAPGPEDGVRRYFKELFLLHQACASFPAAAAALAFAASARALSSARLAFIMALPSLKVWVSGRRPGHP